MLGAFRLTYRIHRFEIIVAIVVAGLAALGLWHFGSQLLEIRVPEGCWPRRQEGEYALPECEDLLVRFGAIEASGGGWARAGLAFLGPVLGVLLGVSIVAREIELRTAELAWSLSRRRSRWLLQRVVPMVVVALVVLVALGALGSRYFDALAQARRWPELTELASQGLPLVARGVLAMGVALLVGAIAGRTMPALVLAVIGVVAWSMLAVPALHGAIAEDQAVWQNGGSWRDDGGTLIYLESELIFDPARPGMDGEPGKRLTEHQRESLLIKTCGPYPDDDQSAEATVHSRCTESFYEDTSWSKVVPQSAYGRFGTIDALVSLLIGGGAFLLTFPVVARRRPN